MTPEDDDIQIWLESPITKRFLLGLERRCGELEMMKMNCFRHGQPQATHDNMAILEGGLMELRSLKSIDNSEAFFPNVN